MGVPLTKEEFVKRHKADLQALGFDIQFLAFVIFLLDIKGGDVIKYETEDDFVVLCADGTKWLIQVKNSVDDNAKMTDADSDFWGTLDNWLTLYAISIIRKTKCYRFTKRNVPKRKTKRLRYRCPPEPYSNSVKTDFFSYSNAIILENQQINTSI